MPFAFGAATYHVQVARDAAFTQIVVEADVATTSFTLGKLYLIGGAVGPIGIPTDQVRSYDPGSQNLDAEGLGSGPRYWFDRSVPGSSSAGRSTCSAGIR